MIIPYTYEKDGIVRQKFTFKVLDKDTIKLIDFESFVRKSLIDPSWKKQKKVKLKEVEVPERIYKVIKEKIA